MQYGVKGSRLSWEPEILDLLGAFWLKSLPFTWPWRYSSFLGREANTPAQTLQS